MKLNIGCGKELLIGFENIDKFPVRDGVKKVDVTKLPLPYQKDTITYIRMRNLLEHLPIPLQLKIFDEFYRICRNKARIWIRVPYGSHWTRRIDHYRGYTFATFEHLDSYWLMGGGRRFRVVKRSDHPTWLGRIFLHTRVRQLLAKFTAGDLFIKDLIVELEVLK